MSRTPKSGQQKGVHISLKYTWKFKLDCVNKYKKGEPLPKVNGISIERLREYVCVWNNLFDKHGEEGLKHSINKGTWDSSSRFALVCKVLGGRSISDVANEAKINPGQLYAWIKKYGEGGLDALECKQGRPVMKKKKVRARISKAEKEELILLRERNEYLEMENEYLKKLDALVSKREAAEAKAKKR